ncbi:MAG: CopD family protein [Rhizomicrobium sp.]
MPRLQTIKHWQHLARLAVGVLLASGLVNSWFSVGSFDHLFGTLYGGLLCLKLALFLLMLGLAAVNRLWITPQYALATQENPVLDSRLRRHILFEQLLELLVLGVVSWLGTLQPPLVGWSM